MKVIGISGSPIANSNTDRAVQAVLDATGMETEFIKLSLINFKPCLACGKCACNEGICIQKDDATELAQRIKDADALVVGGYTPYSSLDGRTKSFLERLYCLHHKGHQVGKPGGIVITSAVPQQEPYPPVAEMAVASVRSYMEGEGMNVVGDVKIVGNIPCLKCGNGDVCAFSGVKGMYGPDATVGSIVFNSFETQPEAVKAAETLGKKIAEELRKK